MKEITLDATLENIATVTAFVDEVLEKINCPAKTQMQINIALDELFGNIAQYAYAPETGKVTVQAETGEGMIRITFIDQGKPYNPLEASEPDTTLTAEERGVGGLGIFMVRKIMDGVSYTYQDRQNCLSIFKRW